MTPYDLLKALTEQAFSVGSIRKIVFSKPREKSCTKAEGRFCRHKDENIIAMEFFLPDGKVKHEMWKADNVAEKTVLLAEKFDRVNLVCREGNAELRQNKKGSAVLVGAQALQKNLPLYASDFSDALAETLSRKKNYILSGGEPFLRALQIADENGRIHDKKQAKFRQINRFLEHVRDIEPYLPAEGPLLIFDLCCGKSYLSFAVYHYFRFIRGREVDMRGMDLKKDCMDFCARVADRLGYDGMHFETGDVRRAIAPRAPDLVLSLHACDIATDIVLRFAVKNRAEVILSTPCCHHDLADKLCIPALSFVTDSPRLRGRLAETLTDALRLSRLRAHGYKTMAAELTDPDDTPKNTLLRAVRDRAFCPDSPAAVRAVNEYKAALAYVLGKPAEDYPEGID